MSRVYVGNLDERITERDLEDEFRIFGVLLRSVRFVRVVTGGDLNLMADGGKYDDLIDLKMIDAEFGGSLRIWWCLLLDLMFGLPPGYAFVEFDDRRDALDAIRELDGKHGWQVELSHNSKGGGGSHGGRSRGEDMKCYECGKPGHFARECRLRISYGGLGSGRCRSPSPRYRRSPSYGHRSYSPRWRSPRRRSVSPPRRGRSFSRSPPYRRVSPYTNGYRRRS